MLTTGVLRIEKRTDGFFFSNPGILRLSLSSIYEGMHTKARNPRIQQMFRMIGYGENIGSGFPSILKVWKKERWAKPELTERQDLNEVHLMLKIAMDSQSSDNLESSCISSDKSSDNLESSCISSDKLTAKQLAILRYLKENPAAIHTDLSQNIADLSFASAKYQVNQLSKAGFIKRQGSNKNGSWIVIDDAR